MGFVNFSLIGVLASSRSLSLNGDIALAGLGLRLLLLPWRRSSASSESSLARFLEADELLLVRLSVESARVLDFRGFAPAEIFCLFLETTFLPTSAATTSTRADVTAAFSTFALAPYLVAGSPFVGPPASRIEE